MNLKVIEKQIRRLVSHLPIPGFTVGVAVGHGALSNFVANLNWANADPTKYLYVGAHGISRGMEEAHRIWQTIPESLRATGPDAVAKHLAGLDWSHVVPFSAGGSNDASNGIFESAGLNRGRGARAMTRNEIRAAQQVLQGKAFSAALSTTASRMFAGAVVAAATGCVFAILEQGLEWQRGRIDREEMFRRIARETGRSAGSGAAVSGLMVAVALAFPPLIPLAAHLMLPLAVMGFCATGHKVVRIGVAWYEVLREPCVRQAPSTFQSVLALPPPTRDHESIADQMARLKGIPAGYRFDATEWNRKEELRSPRPEKML